MSAGDRARLVRDNDVLRKANERLERTVSQREATIATLTRQVESLQQLGPRRSADFFAPARIEIAGLSGGSDFDGNPGDDGVIVYVRPLDQDGDVVKVPGRIRIELVDGSELGRPRVLGVYQFDDLQELRKMWHGKLLTQHYTLRCPFPADTKLPENRRVQVRAEFLDYLSGSTLTAGREVSISY